MFPRQNKPQDQNIRNPRRKPQKKEGGGGIGNEALAQEITGGLIDLISNESNNDVLGQERPGKIIEDELEHYHTNHVANDTINEYNKPEVPKDIRQEGLTDYYQNDLHNYKLKKHKKGRRRKNDQINVPLIPVEDDLSVSAEENAGNQDPDRPIRGMTENEKPDEVDAQSIIEDLPLIIEEDLKKEPDLDSSVSSKSSRSEKSRKGKKSSKKSSSKNAAAPQKDEDLTQIDESLEPVQGWDYATERVPAEKLPSRRKQNFFSKLVSAAAFYSGKTIGKIFGTIATVFSSLYGFFRPGTPGTGKGTWRRMAGIGKIQEGRNRDLIPGWDGAEFEEEEGSEDEVQADFRRVPEIWSWPTAEKAAEGDDKDRKAKPRDPVISVYIAQGSDKYTVTNDMSTGHSGIGIEFSRYNAMSKRWQRYNLRFGYYMGGGMPSTSTFAVTSYNNATIPGQVMNEKARHYDISRSYPAKPKQISQVLRAAESYADRGGYNAYTRNCTTFAKEMIVDVAKIKGAASVFAKDEVYLQRKADTKMMGAAALAPIAKADMENAFAKIKDKDDLSYQNFGNKMLTKEEYERYHDSMSLWSSHSTEADSPNAVAENLKRAEGGGSGTIGIHQPVQGVNKPLDDANFSLVCQDLVPLLSDLKSTLQQITPMNKLLDNGMTPELKRIMNQLDGGALVMQLLKLLPHQEHGLFMQKSKQSDLMTVRAMLTDRLKSLNTLLFRYYRNDKRVQAKVLPIINILNHGLNVIDTAYAQTEEKDVTGDRDSDLGNLLSNYSGESYSLSLNGEEAVMMSPSKYEAWLQVYKTPKKALEQFSRFQELKSKEHNKSLRGAEVKEYNNFLRINELALNFERSHRYMMTKEKYSQQDIDYTFSLAKKELQDNVQSDMLEKTKDDDPTMAGMTNPNASAAGTYKMLIMKTVFGGMKERFKQQFPDKDANDEMPAWLAGDAENCIKNHKKEMTMIIRGLKRAINKSDKETILLGFNRLITKWMFQLFHAEQLPVNYIRMVEAVTAPNGPVMKETEKIVTNVLKEK